MIRRPVLIAALAGLALVAAIASLGFGPVDLSLARLVAAATGHGDRIAAIILLDLRLPRTLLALAVGAILGLAGAALQGYLRNPLAEPSVLGTSNAAALGGVAALYFGFAQMHPAALPLLSIGGALLSLALLFALAGRSESPLTLILAGIAVGTLAVAGTSLALNLSPNPFAAMEIMTWLLGSLENRSFQHVWIALPCVAIGAAMLLWNGRALDALTLGEDAARALGVERSVFRDQLAQLVRAQASADDGAVQMRIEFRQPRALPRTGELGLRGTAAVGAREGALRGFLRGCVARRAGEAERRCVHGDL